MSSSPFVQHGRKTSSIAAASPASRGGVLAFPGNHFSPGTSQHNVPSPATFAKMAAAVGVQNPMEEPSRVGGVRNESGVDIQDPYVEFLSNVDNFLNVELSHLERAGHQFFDQ